MDNQILQNVLSVDSISLEMHNDKPMSLTTQDILFALTKITELKSFFEDNRLSSLNALLTKLPEPTGKQSFLVFKNNKYLTVPTDSIAVFSVEYESTVITCFDRSQYVVNYSLEQIQHMVTCKQFFRVNRQSLINFRAVVEVEHYFGRKLFVKVAVPVREKLFVSKEKSCLLLQWLEDR
jgi:two-component system response regulator LytT